MFDVFSYVADLLEKIRNIIVYTINTDNAYYTLL